MKSGELIKEKKVWYNNGLANKKFIEGEAPDGWVRGMKPYSKEQKDIIEERKKKTYLERYGVENPSQSLSVKKKKEETNLKRRGVKSTFQSKEVQEKSRQTNLERYGVENPSQLEVIKDKKKKSTLDNYGVEHPLQSKEIRERVKKTNLDRYGVEYPVQSDLISEKMRQTNLDRYGTEYTFQSQEVQDRIEKTSLDRYGVRRPSQSDIIKDKTVKTNLERYGVRYPTQSQEVRDKIIGTNQSKYGVSCSFQSEEVKEKIRNTVIEKYGVEYACQRQECRSAYSNNSIPNQKFESILKENNIPYTREFPLGKYSYDFKINNNNILIEINPSATHNTIWSPFHKDRGLDIDYHIKKSLKAEENGFRCIHVFDWDGYQDIINLLLDRDRLYARDCELKSVSMSECEEFLCSHHLQKSCRGQSLRYGLYYNNNLVSLMTFGKPRYNKFYEYELLRYCSSHKVIGGAEKIFKGFLRESNPKNVISYCDRAKFQGDVYNKLGFTLISNGSPSRHWYHMKSKRHLTDNLVRSRGVDQLLGTHYGKGTSNDELLIQNGFVPIYDCGQATYIYQEES